MKKEEDNEKEIVDKLSDIYDVGSFAQIQEMQDLGEKLRLVVTAHRRIKIVGQLVEEYIEEEKSEIKTIKKGISTFFPNHFI